MWLFPIIMALCLGVSAKHAEPSKLYREGRKAEKHGDIARAYILYSEAAAAEPNKHLYWARAQALQSRAAMDAKVVPDLAASLNLSDISDEKADDAAAAPEPETASPKDIADAQKLQPPAKLTATPGRQDFNLSGNAKTLFEKVAHAFGLDCVFDSEYTATNTIRFRMDQADYREALHGLEAVTGSFLVPVSEKLFMVVKDTTQKRHDQEPFAAIIVHLPEPTTTQDLTAMITAVQQACGIQKVAWDSQRNVVVMKDTVSKILPAQQLFKDLLYRREEVMFELQMIEVTKDDMLNYGITFPNTLPLVSFAQGLTNTPQVAANVAGMLLFGGGATLFGVGVVNSQIAASLTRSSGDVMLHAYARSLDGLPATIHVGQKYPILTAGYFGPSNFSNGNTVVPPPAFTFEDLGLSVKATPHSHLHDEVSVTLEAEFKLLTGTSSNGIPVISNRSLKSETRMKFGEWAVIAGLMQVQDARTIAGIAGLASVPLLGPLMRNTNTDKQSDKVILMLRPTLLAAPPEQVVTHVFRMGSETKPLTPL